MRSCGRTLMTTASSAAVAAAIGVASAASSDPASFLDAVRRPGLPAGAGSASASALRKLEDAAGNSYSYLDDLSGHGLMYGKCIRVKIPQENDNDDDGNTYFYNGRYHAPSMAYASFYLCSQSGSNDQCGACDYSTEYALPLEDFLDRQVEYVQNYCNSCAAQCRRRRAEDEDSDEDEEDENGGGDQNMAVDCDRCVDECSLLLAGNEGNDETYYLECQESHQDENGVQYYAGPACDSDTGGLAVGLYYDDECTMKSQRYDNGFAFNTFGTIESVCADCSYGDCDDLYDESSHCVNGYDQQGGDNGDDDDDEMPVCKTFKKASKEWTYAKAKGKNKFVPVIITVLVLCALGSACAFLSYTYYIRHKRAETESMQVPLEGAGGDVQQDLAVADGQMT